MELLLRLKLVFSLVLMIGSGHCGQLKKMRQKHVERSLSGRGIADGWGYKLQIPGKDTMS